MTKKILSLLFVSLFALALAAQGVKVDGEYLANLGDKKSYKFVVKERNADYCATYLTTFSESKYKAKVAELYDELFYIAAYDKATATFDVSDLETYLVKFANGKYREKAGEAVDIISWQKARSENTVLAYKGYINDFPKGKAVSLAKKAVAELK